MSKSPLQLSLSPLRFPGYFVTKPFRNIRTTGSWKAVRLEGEDHFRPRREGGKGLSMLISKGMFLMVERRTATVRGFIPHLQKIWMVSGENFPEGRNVANKG